MRKLGQRFIAVALVVSLFVPGLIFAQGMSGMVNINTADETSLVALEQIGKSRAQAIMKHRDEHGAFQTIDELKDVPGIGNKIFEMIKDKITVGNDHQ